MIYILVVFDPGKGQLIRESVFDDPAAAEAAYRSEEASLAPTGDVEVVLIGTESRESIYATHGHYFATALDTPWSSLLDRL